MAVAEVVSVSSFCSPLHFPQGVSARPAVISLRPRGRVGRPRHVSLRPVPQARRTLACEQHRAPVVGRGAAPEQPHGDGVVETRAVEGCPTEAGEDAAPEINASASVGASGEGDSPKPHGDKHSTLSQGAAGGAGETGRAGGAVSGDSPKPHGDKLASAREGAAYPDVQPNTKE